MAATEQLVGREYGNYQLLEEVARGGMGLVLVGRDIDLSRDVALKVLPEELAESEERRSRFEREAKAVSSLSHPHICTIHEIDEFEGKFGYKPVE